MIREADTFFSVTHADPEEFDVRAPDGVLLRGWKVTPPNPHGSWVLLFHGVADNRVGVIGQSEFLLRAGYSVLISTGDKDMAQLVDGSITLINTMSNTVLDRAGVKAKFDVQPEQIIDYLALIGDSSDNIPGIDKVGPKTAAKLLEQYGTLDNLIAHVQDISGKVGENLRAGLVTLELSRKLATIHTDLDLPLSVDELLPGAPDTEQLRELYTRYELRSLLRQLDGANVTPPATPVGNAADASESRGAVVPDAAKIEPRYETITQWQDLERWLETLRTAKLFAFDTETTSLDYMRAEIVGVSFSIEPGVAAYVPLHHDYAGAPEQLDRDRVLAALKPILEDPERAKLGHHLKYDAHVLANAGIDVQGYVHDTMLQSYVLEAHKPHSLESLAERHLGLAK